MADLSVNVSDSATLTEDRDTVLAEPTSTEWSGYRDIFAPGLNQWDHIFWGGLAGRPLKVGGVYYFFYCGSDNGDESNGDNNRSIGLVTSQNFLTWTKHPSNPLVTYTSTGGVETEEGASNPVVLYDSGTWHMWYSASRYNGIPDQVDVDIRYRTSVDGVTWTDDTLIYSAAGEEHKSIGAVKIGSTFYLYCLGDLVSGRGDLWVVSGADPSSLSGKTTVLSGTWVQGTINELNGDILSLAIAETNFDLRWYRIDKATPTVVSSQIGSTDTAYALPWFMFKDGDVWREVGLGGGNDGYRYRHSPAALAAQDTDGNDAVGVADAPTLSIIGGSGPDLSVAVSDSVRVSDDLPGEEILVGDNAELSIPTEIFVNESAAVIDSPALYLGVEISIADNSAVTDAPQVDAIISLTASESTVVSDDLAAQVQAVGEYLVNVSDDAAVADSPTPQVDAAVNAADALAVAEALDLDIILEIAASEAAGVSDLPGGSIEANIAVGEDVAASETLEAQEIIDVALNESATVNENISLTVVSAGQTLINVGDGVAIAEIISVTASVPAFLAASGADVVALAESVALEVQSQARLADNVSASEAIALFIYTQLSADEDVTLEETVAIVLSDPLLAVGDTVTTSDVPSVVVVPLPLSLSVAESAVVSDAPSAAVLLPDVFYSVSVSDSVSLSEMLTLVIVVMASPTVRTRTVPWEDRVLDVAYERRTITVKKS